MDPKMLKHARQFGPVISGGIKHLLVFGVLCVTVFPLQSAPPPLAAAAGYTVNTFSSTFDAAQVDINNSMDSGYNWYMSRFWYGPSDASTVTLNSDASVTLKNNSGAGMGIASAGENSKGGGWVGTAFGGGGYFEAIFKFDPDLVSGSGFFWPAWWSISIEHCLNSAQWVGQASGYEHFVEPDFFEYDVASWLGKNYYGGAFHDWSGVYDPIIPYVNKTQPPPPAARSFCIAAPGIDAAGAGWKQYHKVSFLWLPATATTNGHGYFCFDDQKTTDSVSWTLYTNQAPSSPTTMDPWTYGIIDSQHLVLILGNGCSSPFTVQSVNVWQKTGYYNGVNGVMPAPPADQNLPLITPVGGTSIDSVLVSMITLASSGVTIRYTLDGSTPTGSSTAYTGPLALKQSTVLKACGFGIAGNSAVVTQSYKIVPRVVKPSHSGLQYAYYEYDGAPWISVKSKDWSQYTVKASGTTDSFNLGMARRNNKFAVRFYGTISIPTGGLYTFTVNSDAGANLFMGDYLIVANDGTHSLTTGGSGAIRLPAGCYPIALDYYMDSTVYSGGVLKPALNVYYKGPGIAKTIIPKSVLFNDNVAVKGPVAGKVFTNNSLAYSLNKESVLITVGFQGRYQLEIVKPNGAVVLHLSGTRPANYAVKRSMLPAGIYMLRATDAAGKKIAKLMTWY
ncbi:MAG: chitobiase/beta-hexosaminidase C-terminal domain-containing protein [Chitinivibrionales bacterium]|nr:chitobiase/beta-hexosaminidase C-terminal domain-containing protein [Chitinivibrionales bacterium]